MPVSHLGLTVSHISSATSFYLATLGPLGYRCFGQSGDSVGLGVDRADLFLTQEPRGQAVSPAHVAFTADSRLTVRNCYAAALSSGAHPSGAPSYRDRDCTVFNAAIEDPDGNVVEFVHREVVMVEEESAPVDASQQNQVLSWQRSVANSSLHDDIDYRSSRASRAKSRAETVHSLVTSASRSVRTQSEAPTRGLTRAQTMPHNSSPTPEFPSKAMLGTLLGATAGAVLAWTMIKTETRSTRDQAAYDAFDPLRSGSRRSASETRPHRNYSTTESQAPKSHRNLSTTESTYGRKYPPRSLIRGMGQCRRAIEPVAYYQDDEVQDAISRVTASRRPAPPGRSRTMVEALEYSPWSEERRSSRSGASRAALLPVDKPYGYLEGPMSTSPTSQHSRTSRNSAAKSSRDPDNEPRHSRPSSSRHSTTSRQSRREIDEEGDRRRDSGISLQSRRSLHSRRSTRNEGDNDTTSNASTLKPDRRSYSCHESAAGVPLPGSQANPTASTAKHSRAGSRATYVTAAQVPILETYEANDYRDTEESDGMDDMKTVVPDDSISCVDFSKPKLSARNRSDRGDSRSRRSEAAESERTARATRTGSSKHSAAAMPDRSRGEQHNSHGRRRSMASYS
ncbi:hypothetical protein LTR78_002804 [Recurvomyces mirabilis]|uniref:VOC domain-containing protein n=1 Tax=Recurvomyces mirabilis TaxID=574656 RepID=A0AAE0WSJ4_9PEZI|nr:hypothetical protein LTR78_002804 [Recurvomyces mirabilis]KAK5159462.1 hypothetical protein LTS14_002604 [Recurvomyces mirabilis]